MPITPLTRLLHASLAVALLAAAYEVGTFDAVLFWAGVVAPDLALVGAFAGGGLLKPERVGTYNAVHTWWGPLAVAAPALAVPALVPLALGWAFHVAWDRALGYGLRAPGGGQRHHAVLPRPA